MLVRFSVRVRSKERNARGPKSRGDFAEGALDNAHEHHNEGHHSSDSKVPSASTICATGVCQSFIVGCRNNRMVGYQGESGRSKSQRKSASNGIRTQTGLA